MFVLPRNLKRTLLRYHSAIPTNLEPRAKTSILEATKLMDKNNSVDSLSAVDTHLNPGSVDKTDVMLCSSRFGVRRSQRDKCNLTSLTTPYI